MVFTIARLAGKRAATESRTKAGLGFVLRDAHVGPDASSGQASMLAFESDCMDPSTTRLLREAKQSLRSG